MKTFKNIQAVIFDWAGTLVDYGCIAPTRVFIDVFKQRGISISMEAARGPMGLAKKDHVRTLLFLEETQKQWIEKYGQTPTENDVSDIYSDLEPSLAKIVADYSNPVPGAVELVEALKTQKIKTGSTTGYVAEMMANILPHAAAFGLKLDAMVSSSDVQSGRPSPWMIYRNCELLDVFPPHCIVKIGDTVADIQEGKNAGTWTIGLTKSGNETGLSLAEIKDADPFCLNEKLLRAEEKLRQAGADFIAEGLWECAPILKEIDTLIGQGLYPKSRFL